MFPYKGTDFGADPEEIEEERRLAYVAITRARERLVLVGELPADLRPDPREHPEPLSHGDSSRCALGAGAPSEPR